MEIKVQCLTIYNYCLLINEIIVNAKGEIKLIGCLYKV